MKFNLNFYMIFGFTLVVFFIDMYFRILGKQKELLENDIYNTGIIISLLILVAMLIAQIFKDKKNMGIYILTLVPYTFWAVYMISQNLDVGMLEFIIGIIWIPIFFSFIILRAILFDIDRDELDNKKPLE